jgi:hypothetical protein
MSASPWISLVQSVLERMRFAGIVVAQVDPVIYPSVAMPTVTPLLLLKSSSTKLKFKR